MIGIYAPYDWSGETTLAVRLADYLLQLGVPVSYYAYGNVAVGVHPEWDHKVVNGKRMPFGYWAMDRSHIISTTCHLSKLIVAQDLNVQTTLILLLDQINQYTELALGEFDHVLCPSPFVASVLNRRWNSDLIDALPWDTGLPLLRKPTYTSKGTLWMYVPLTAAVSESMGASLLHTFQILLENCPSLYLTVSRTKRWTPGTLEALGEISTQHRDRFRLVSKPGLREQLALYRTHDFAYYPHCRDDVGLYALESLACGTPVVTPDSDTLSDIVIPAHNGLVLPCSLKQGEHNMSIIPDITPGQTLSALTRLVTDTFWLDTIGGTQWPELENRRRLFHATWRSVLNLCS